jgi:hypothetical protein
VVIVEPGPFKTDFLSRSLVECPPHPEYAQAMKATREYFAKMEGHQPGDPVRAAKAMLEVVSLERPPLRLPLGKITLDRMKAKLAQLSREFESGAAVALAADFPK